MKELIAMVGLPRSGKSTLCKLYGRQFGAPIVNRDAIRLALHGMRYQGEAEPMVKAISLYMIKALFLTGYDIVLYDETNYSRAARDYIKSPYWKTSFVVVPTSPEVCKERAVKTGQEDLIKVIDEMYARYEPCGEDEPHIVLEIPNEKDGKQEGPTGGPNLDEVKGVGGPDQGAGVPDVIPKPPRQRRKVANDSRGVPKRVRKPKVALHSELGEGQTEGSTEGV